ncbi:unnamed protein product [Sphagnum balticum]
MDKLSEEDSWRLFCVHAFGQYNIPPGVEGLAHLVVEECQGLPLALKVIGGVMVGKKWPGEWERELKKLEESRMKHQDVEKQLFDCLKTSYDDLENADHPNAKECFLCFAAFREDELLEQTSHDADEKKQLALYRPGCHLQEFPLEWRTNAKELLAVRRLSLNDNNLKTLPTKISAPNMQTLLLSHNEQLEDLPNGFLKGIQQNLNVLDLSFNKSLKALPRGCYNLKHLIYLHLGNCEGLQILPPSMGNLQNLKNLHLKSCTHLRKVPISIGKLQKLEVLDLENCANLKQLPKSIGELEMLVTLNLFQCSALKCLPFQYHSLKRLESLNLLGCDNLDIGIGNLLIGLVSLKNLKIRQTLAGIPYMSSSGEFVQPLLPTLIPSNVKSMIKLEDFTLNTFVHVIEGSGSQEMSLLNLKTLTLNFCPTLLRLKLNDCPSLVNLTLNDCPNLERVELTNCPNLVCLPALDNFPRLGSLVLRLSIKELPQSFTRRGAFPALKLFDLRQSGLVEFPEVEEGAMPTLHCLHFDDCLFLHTLPASIALLTSISTIDLGSKNEKLITFCKANFTNSPIWKSFNVDGKPLILEEEVFESAVPMEEGTIAMQGNEKRPFQKVHGDDEDRLIKRGGSILGSGFLAPSNPKRLVYLGSSSGTTKIEKEHSLREAL